MSQNEFSETIGIGAIGLGGMGKSDLHRMIKASDQVKLHAVYDPDPKATARGRELAPDIIAYDSVEALLKDPEVDWVWIASWNSAHCEQTVAAFEAGKHVFCQKPLATNLEDCLAMCRAWQESGKMFSIGFVLRYSPHYRKIKKLLSDGAIGDIISMEFNETLNFNQGGYIMGDWRRRRENAGTHLLEKCCHDVDLVNWMVGSRASRVASFGGLNFFLPGNEKHIARIGKNKHGKDAYRTWGGTVDLNPFTSDKDIVDNQVAIIEYENGVRTTFHTNCNTAIPERRMYICGTEGTLRANVLTGEIELKRIGFDTEMLDESTEGKGGHGGGGKTQADEVLASMLQGVAPAAGLVDGLKSAVTCFAIDDAMDNGTVVDCKPYWEKVDEVLGG